MTTYPALDALDPFYPAGPPGPAEGKPGTGAAGGFPCPEDVTVSPVIATISSAGRASLSVQVPSSGRREWMPWGETEIVVDEWGEILLERPNVPDVVRAARNQARAVARAKQAVSDYMVVNQTTKMWTFTYAVKCFNFGQVVEDVHAFMVRWRSYEGGRPFPYVRVIEQHQDGSYHVHFAVREDHYTDFFALRRLWGHGRIRFDARRKSRDTSRRSVSRMASYLTKYLAKNFGDEVEAGRHRYEVGQGFQPGVVSRRFKSLPAARSWLLACNPGLREVWCSMEDPNWIHSFPVWSFESDYCVEVGSA